MAPMYLIRIIGNTLTYLTSKLEVGRVELDFAECVFKYNAIIGNNTVVQQMITSTNLVGQSIIGYLRERGYSDVSYLLGGFIFLIHVTKTQQIPLDFIKDPKSKFDMAMSCKNFQVAFDIAKNLEDIEIWDILGQEAFKYGEIEVA